MKAFVLAAALAVLASPAWALPSGYTLVFSDVPTSAADLADGTSSAPTAANWFYNVYTPTLRDPLRDTCYYDACGDAAPAYDPFTFNGDIFGVTMALHNHAQVLGHQYWTSAAPATVNANGTQGHTFGYGYFQWRVKATPALGGVPSVALISAPGSADSFTAIINMVGESSIDFELSITDNLNGAGWGCRFNNATPNVFHTLALQWVQGTAGADDTMTMTVDRKDFGCHFPITDATFKPPVYAAMAVAPATPGNQPAFYTSALKVSQFLVGVPTAP